MARGKVEFTGENVLKLHLQDNFDGYALNSWAFNNWSLANRLPATVIYENIEPMAYDGTDVQGGSVIGRAEEVRISILYSDSQDDSPKYVHPAEFLSLLFWMEKYDPLLAADESIRSAIRSHDISNIDFSDDSNKAYESKLIQKMMVKNESGSDSDFMDDTWLGLRPPLRTIQRVRWEVIKEHLTENFSGLWDRGCDVSSRLKNPYVYKRGGYSSSGITKCNIFVADMLYRAGFKTIVAADGLGCERSQVQCRLKYRGPTQLYRNFKDKAEGEGIQLDGYININLSEAQKCGPDSDKTHRLRGSFALRSNCDTALNDAMRDDGDAFLYIKNDTLFIWDNVPGDPQEEAALKEALKSGYQLDWASGGIFTKSDDDTQIIMVSGSHKAIFTKHEKSPGEYSVKMEVDGSDKKELNVSVSGDGRWTVKTSDHIVIVDKFVQNSPPKVRALDQWHRDWSIENYYHMYTTPALRAIVLKAIPGGDPGQEWGILDLNSLTPL
jgi:hypothetical protein